MSSLITVQIPKIAKLISEFGGKFKYASSSLFEKDSNVIAHVKVFNLKKKFDPSETYNLIQCRKSATIIVETTLCVHDIKRDTRVSASIWKNGVWEAHILGFLITYFLFCKRL
jgi:hypothetical protein